MALKATIFKALIQVADIDRSYYHEHALTLARHPSETDLRMMIRLLAFALHASDTLQFTKGLSNDDEPELWQRSLSDEIELWIELGEPDEKRLRKACNRSKQVRLYCYGGRSVPPWWEQNKDKLKRFDNLSILNLPEDATEQLAQLAQKNMQLEFTIQDGHVFVSDGQSSVGIEPVFFATEYALTIIGINHPLDLEFVSNT
jgi:uncharacterized protein YaeQ